MNKDIEGKMMDKISGMLTEREAAEFERYLKDQTEEAEDLQFFQQSWSDLDKAKWPEMTDDIGPSFYSRLEKVRTKENRSIGKKWTLFKQNYIQPAFLARASAAVLLLTLGLILGGKTNWQPFPATDMVAAQPIANYTYATEANPQGVPASMRLKQMYHNSESEDEKRVIKDLFLSLQNDPNVNVRLMAVEELSTFAGQSKVREQLTKQVSSDPSPLVQAELLNTIMAQADVKESIATMENLLRDKNLNLFVKEKIHKDLPVLRASITFQ